jgi:hypothetical protein
MNHASRVLLALFVSFGIGGQCLWAQTSKDGEKAPSPAAVVRPLQVDLLALQVSKLPRNAFGQGVKPDTNETVAFWLANSGTGLELRLKLDRPIVRFDAEASRLIRFADDKDGDMSRPPKGVLIDTFFPDNKPIVVKLGPKPDEAEVILRGYGTPARGATKLQVHADLVFVGGAGETTVEGENLDPKPGTKATIGPLCLTFIEPEKAGPPPRLNALFPRPPRGGDAGSTQFAFEYERPERSIKSVTCLNAKGETVQTLAGNLFASDRGGSVIFNTPTKGRIRLRVVYFERSEPITVPIRLETGLGF